MKFATLLLLTISLLLVQQHAHGMFVRVLSQTKTQGKKSPRIPLSPKTTRVPSKTLALAGGCTAGYMTAQLLMNLKFPSSDEEFTCEKYTCEESCFLVGKDNLACCFDIVNDEYIPSNAMLVYGNSLSSSGNDADLVKWCKILVRHGVNPTPCFSAEKTDDQQIEFTTILLVQACYANMPKIVVYLMHIHLTTSFDCMIDETLPDQPNCTVGQRALEAAKIVDNHECVEILEKYLGLKTDDEFVKAKL